ncbi:uncharacterized protein [Ptychodera flava]|uniref:uncharacterized protein n=1 Tax=Ptychodera flava TaxID=63121 RepID=UPI00396A3033
MEHFMAIVIPAACLTLASLILIMFMCYKFDHLVFTHGSGLWYILRDEFCRISLIVPTFAVTWIIGLQDVTGNMYYGYTYAFACFIVGSVCYLAFFATNKVVLRSIRSRFYGNGDDDPDEISFSPYGSDDEEDEYIDTIPARSRPSSNVPTSSKASVCVLEMQSLSRRTTPGEVTIAEHGESSGESSTRLSGQARVSRDVTPVLEESSEEDDVDHVVGSTLFYKPAN